MNPIKVLSKDPIMRRLVDTHTPVLIGMSPLFESLVGAVISQQLSESASATIYKRLKDISPITPESLSDLDAETFRSCGISKQKAVYIKSISEAALNGGLDNIKDLPEDEIIKTLMKLKGVGL